MTYKIIFILGIFLSSVSHGEKRTELTFSSEPGNHYHGFCTALFKEFNKEPGSIRIKSIDINLARAYQFLLDGTIDGNCARIKGISRITKESRDVLVELEPTLFELKFVVLARNEKIAQIVEEGVDYSKISMGIPTGARYFEKLFVNTAIYPLGNTQIGLNMLAAGRLDAMIAAPTFELFKKLDKSPVFRMVSNSGLTLSVVSIINKKSLRYKDELQRVLQNLKDKGVIEKLIRTREIDILIDKYQKKAR